MSNSDLAQDICSQCMFEFFLSSANRNSPESTPEYISISTGNFAVGVHFVLREKNAGNFELLSLGSKSHAGVVQFRVGVLYMLCSSLYDICCLLSYKFQE